MNQQIRKEYSQEQRQKLKEYLEYATKVFAERFNSDFAQMQIFGNSLKEIGIPKDGFETIFASELVYLGWFLFASGWGGFMPKLHQERCILTLDNWDCQTQFTNFAVNKGESSGQKPSALIRQLKKILKSGKENFILTINTNFEEAMELTNKFQEKNQGCTWVEPKLVKILIDLKDNPIVFEKGEILQAMSWEVREESSNKLIAADIGYRMGGIYSSMTGFSDRAYPGLGLVQLFAQGSILKEMGFNMWDFGMFMNYKGDLGAKNLTRKPYLMRQKIAKGIKIQNIDVNNNKITLKPTKLQDIKSFQKIKESYYNNLQTQKQLNQRSEESKDSLSSLEKIDVKQWSKEQVQQWLKLRFNNKNKTYDFSNFDNFNTLLELEQVFDKLKVKNRSKKICKLAKYLVKKQDKNQAQN